MPLPRKQIMNGSEVFPTCVMVSLSRFKKIHKGDLIIIVAQEILSCPCCEGDLFVRGTCHRKAINSAGTRYAYRLRVLQCRNCQRTHRELPEPLVPYKRYDGEAILFIENTPSQAPCDFRTVELIQNWLEWFISYAGHICAAKGIRQNPASGIHISCADCCKQRKLVAQPNGFFLRLTVGYTVYIKHTERS